MLSRAAEVFGRRGKLVSSVLDCSCVKSWRLEAGTEEARLWV